MPELLNESQSDYISRYTSEMIIDANNNSISDIHIEPNESDYRIRMRRNGCLSTYSSIPRQIAIRMIAHIKVLSQMNTVETRLPQDGSYMDKTHRLHLRVSSLPTIQGEKVVLRILQSHNKLIDVNDLGMQENQLTLFKEAIQQPDGLIIMTGPTGCGKTTTLYAALNYLHSSNSNIVSIENPVEINIPHVNQVNIAPELHFDFADALRSVLRQDPDIIMVGEIRDSITAKITFQAAQTGHLVLATLHAKSPIATFARLKALGISFEDALLTINLIISQRLIKEEHDKRKANFQLLPITSSLTNNIHLLDSTTLINHCQVI